MSYFYRIYIFSDKHIYDDLTNLPPLFHKFSNVHMNVWNIIIFKSNHFGIIIANPAWLWESWGTNYMCRSIMPKYHLTVSANLFFFCFQVTLSTDLFDRVLPFSFLEVVLFLSCAFECPALLLWITCTFSCNFFQSVCPFLI